MNVQSDLEKTLTLRSRVVAVVIAVGGLIAIVAPWLVAVFGLPIRYEFLFYFASLAAFAWAIVNIYQIWRTRRDNQG